MSQFSRQTFLGKDGEARLASARIGLVGLGGGGSHVAQQLGHIGVGAFVLADPDHVELTNLNRLVGATALDVERRTVKVEVARRLIQSVNPSARVEALPVRWQSAGSNLADCDVILGGVDSWLQRAELEAFCRRLMIPYIDMGMDVHELEAGEYSISGQTILSMPGRPCLRCLGVITDRLLSEEAAKYGAAGAMPQVVWPNAILASFAVGLTVKLLTPWYEVEDGGAYLEFNGNADTVATSNRFKAIGAGPCPHHPPEQYGDPLFDIRQLGPEAPEPSRGSWVSRLSAGLAAMARAWRRA